MPIPDLFMYHSKRVNHRRKIFLFKIFFFLIFSSVQILIITKQLSSNDIGNYICTRNLYRLFGLGPYMVACSQTL